MSWGTRRDWLRASGAGVAGAMIPACGAAGGEATALVVEVSETQAIVAVWAAGAASAEITVETFDRRSVGRSVVSLGAGGSGSHDFGGLSPGTQYRACICTSDGTTLPPYQFVTAPTDQRAVRIAVSADVDTHPAFDSPIFDTLAATDADLYVSLGDWPYADNPPFSGTEENYRDRHVEARMAPRFQPWLTRMSVRAIYDDHEVRNNWDGASFAADPVLHETALAVWDEFFPRRGTVDSPRYRRWSWGPHVDCFLLDTRRYRSPSADPDDDRKSMLGAVQRVWLLEHVTASSAAFKLIFTSVPLDYGDGFDHWAGYTYERDAIFDALADAGTPGILFVSADQHWFASHVHRHGAREFQVGPLARGLPPPPAPRPGVLASVVAYNVGLIDIDGSALRFRALGPTGQILYDETLAPGDLRLRRP